MEGFKRYLARYAAGRRVRGVRVLDAQVVRNVSGARLAEAVVGCRMGRPSRHGKWLIVPLCEGRLVFHFGMTGGLAWTGRPDGEPRWTRVVFELVGGRLSYHAMRKLGGVWWLAADRALEEVTGTLGPDAAAIDGECFVAAFAERRGRVKAALMDQRLIAGIGNELSDEILWRARIRPDKPVPQLSRQKLEALDAARKEVLRASMKRGRIPHERGWLQGQRGARSPRCPRCRGAVRKDRVAGRTAYWCPRCQR